jgi:hypothetical protein
MTEPEPDDKSRRSFMKKGALASGAAALALGSSGSVTGETSQQQQLDTGLVFVDDYRPGVPFQVVSRMQQTTVNDILGTEVNGPVVTDPTDYNGYIYTYQGCGGGNYGLAFVREGNIQQDQTYSFSADATFFSNDIQLLEAGMQQGGGGGGGGNQTASG